jgi:hypothetical protein
MRYAWPQHQLIPSPCGVQGHQAQAHVVAGALLALPSPSSTSWGAVGPSLLWVSVPGALVAFFSSTIFLCPPPMLNDFFFREHLLVALSFHTSKRYLNVTVHKLIIMWSTWFNAILLSDWWWLVVLMVDPFVLLLCWWRWMMMVTAKLNNTLDMLWYCNVLVYRPLMFFMLINLCCILSIIIYIYCYLLSLFL